MVRGIYIHIPFCSRICSYCDFFVKKDTDQIEKYLNALLKEIDIFKASYPEQYSIDNIYIGGGTPSLLTSEQINILLQKLYDEFDIEANAEISMESNPASLDLEKMQGYKESGINRLSVGVQTFVKRELGLLKRNHSPKRAIKALEDAAKIKFDTLSCDLIFSVPGQTNESWQETLNIATSLDINHISTYNLTFEEGTPLFEKWRNGEIEKYNPDIDEEFYIDTINFLSEKGFDQYEVSNFSKDGHRCNHNLNTWNSGEYLAFGVSSHGYFKSKRYSNHRNLEKYFDSISNNELPVSQKYNVNEKMYAEEKIILGLRALGLDLSYFNKYPNLSSELKTLSEKLESSEIGEVVNNVFRLSSKGYAICDTVTLKYLNILDKYTEKLEL